MNTRSLCMGLVIAVASSVAPVQAADKGDALLDLLVKKGTISKEEAAQVKAEWDKQLATAIEKQDKTKVSKWVDSLKWTGDLRVRGEFFDNEDQSSTIDRWRFRYRLRLGLEAKMKDWATVGLRLASGGEDPVSSNQSFQDTFSRKPVGIDLAYVVLQPPAWDWVKISAGKINNPVWQTGVASPLIWDHDVTPEGLAEQLTWKFGNKKQHTLFANFGQYVLDEISNDANDPYLLEFQAGVQATLGKAKLTLAGSYYQTFNLTDMGVFIGAAVPASQSSSANRGNATRQPGGAGTTLFYLDDFQVVSVRAEAALTLADKPFLGTPVILTLSGEYVHNLANEFDNLTGSTQTLSPGQTDGWTVQAAFGSNKNQGEWQIAYQYKHLEADAVWDAISDADWGTGSTDRKGHVLKGSYNVRDWWQLGFTMFVTEKISLRPNSGQNIRGLKGDDLLRLQLDSSFKF